MPTPTLTPSRIPRANRAARLARRAAHTRCALLDTLESRVLLSVSTLHEYRGVNAQDVWDGHNSASDTASWDMNIIREGLFNFDAAALDTSTTQADGYWLHGMQNIVNQNASAGDITIICPFSWDNSALSGNSPAGLGSAWSTYQSRLTDLGSQYAGQESDVWLEIWNEPYVWNQTTNSATWLSDMETAVSAIRDGGFTGTIVVPGGSQGADESPILDSGQTLVNDDPNHNIVFDLHAYDAWEYGYTQAQITSRINTILDTGLNVIFGEVGPGNSANLDVGPMLGALEATHVSGLAWSWNYNDADKLVNSDGSLNDTSTNHNYASQIQGYTTGTRVSLPSGWSDSDVGGPTIAGGAGYDDATHTFAVSGSGSDIWNNADQFNYLHQSVSSDSSVVAQVTSQGDTDGWAKSGVMFRDSTGAGAINAGVYLTPANGVAFQWRTSTGGASSSSTATGITGPVWVKLSRSGNNFSAYYSSDGSNWTQVGSTESIAMSSSYLGGLAVSAHTNSATSYATFANVTVGSSLLNQTIEFTADGSSGYVTNVQNSSGYLQAWSTSGGTWADFTLVDAGGGYVALKSNLTGDYISVNHNSSDLVQDIGATSILSWEKFQLVWVNQSAGQFALKSNISGYYVSCNVNNYDTLQASWATTIGSWETYTLV